MFWNYFATGHGKGKVDGVGALLKRELHKEQIKPQGLKIQNVKEVVNLLQSKANKFHAAKKNAQIKMNKTLWEVKVGDVDKSKGFHCQTIAGNQKSHQAQSVTCQDPKLLKYRDISYFCVGCQNFVTNIACEHV